MQASQPSQPEQNKGTPKEPTGEKSNPFSDLTPPPEGRETTSPAQKPSPEPTRGRLPQDAPDRIDFQSRLVLYKQAQTEDMLMYITHIKDKPTFIFVMDRYDPETAIDWRGAFRNRDGLVLTDRDGVVKDFRFLNDTKKESAEDVMVPGSLEGGKELNEANIGVAFVTNQGGRDSLEDKIAINVRVAQQMANAGGHVDAIFICPFAKHADDIQEGTYDARKPDPGMFIFAEKLAENNNVPVLASVGDQRTDGAAIQRAGQKFSAITGPTGRWNAELAAARKRGKELPELNTDPEVYQEFNQFSAVVDHVLGRT
jgi:D-glycero-D-manno-heptose 1,7-bisphosphate phosphatase